MFCLIIDKLDKKPTVKTKVVQFYCEIKILEPERRLNVGFQE